MGIRFDIHLSAYRISTASIARLEALGLARDQFANNTRCDTTEYHGTYRGPVQLPNDALWTRLQLILDRDPTFVGSLEEESFDSSTVTLLSNSQPAPQRTLVPLQMRRPNPGEAKACDIHINICLKRTSDSALESISSLELAAFDKPDEGHDHRVFTATCSKWGAGQRLYRGLELYLGSVPSLYGRMKLEQTIRYLRTPSDAPALPLADDRSIAAWLRQIGSAEAYRERSDAS